MSQFLVRVTGSASGGQGRLVGDAGASTNIHKFYQADESYLGILPAQTGSKLLVQPTTTGPNTGTLAVSEAPDVAALAGVRESIGTLAPTEVADASALAGIRISVGLLGSTEPPDIAAFSSSPPVADVIIIRGGDDAPRKRRKSSREQVDELLERVQKDIEHTALQKAAVELVSAGVLKKEEFNLEEDDEEILLLL